MAQSRSTFLKRPCTRLGWWAVGLAAATILMNMINAILFNNLERDAGLRQTIMPYFGIFMLSCGLATLVVGLIAILRNHERSWLVWLTLLPGMSALLFILGEFLIPH